MSEESEYPFAMIDPRFELGYFILEPDEAEQIGFLPIRWYCMPASDRGRMFTSITPYAEAVEVLGRAGLDEDVPEDEVVWALSRTATIPGSPTDWKRLAREGLRPEDF